jgi:hypothetical protein
MSETVTAPRSTIMLPRYKTTPHLTNESNPTASQTDASHHDHLLNADHDTRVTRTRKLEPDTTIGLSQESDISHSRAKRARLFSEEVLLPIAPEVSRLRHYKGRPDPQLWCPHGDFIVMTKENYAFRLHSDVHARLSPFLREMLAKTYPGESDDNIEGCPVIRIQDEAHDFAALIIAMCDGG